MKKSPRRFAARALPCAVWLALGLTQGQSVQAHHSSAVYDMSKRISVKGTVTKVMWVNPHAYFELDAKSPDGSVTHWEFLLNSPNEMMRAGWPRDTLKLGDLLTVEASPGRGRETRAFAWFATFPDGRKVLSTE